MYFSEWCHLSPHVVTDQGDGHLIELMDQLRIIGFYAFAGFHNCQWVSLYYTQNVSTYVPQARSIFRDILMDHIRSEALPQRTKETDIARRISKLK